MLTADQMMLAIGRIPNTEELGLEAAGVETGKLGEIVVDPYSRTSVDNIWSIGDVTNRVQLTPVAIHEAICFVETRVQGQSDQARTTIPSRPPSSRSPRSARSACPRRMRPSSSTRLEIYLAPVQADAQPVRRPAGPHDAEAGGRRPTRVVLGAHMLGPEAGEMAQLIGIAVKARLTKDDFDRTMALHPTVAEELVTMYEPSYRSRTAKGWGEGPARYLRLVRTPPLQGSPAGLRGDREGVGSAAVKLFRHSHRHFLPLQQPADELRPQRCRKSRPEEAEMADRRAAVGGRQPALLDRRAGVVRRAPRGAARPQRSSVRPSARIGALANFFLAAS